MGRPSETITATVGTLLGAVLSILGFASKLELPAEVVGALVTLVSFVAMVVTGFVAKRQRAGDSGSAKDGTVT